MESTTSLWWKELPVVLVRSQTTSFADLPREIVTNIFSRLPVKSVIRSTSVSKLWCSLIKEPGFVAAHLSRSISSCSSDGYVLVAPKLLRRQPHCYVFSDNEDFSHHSSPKIPFRTRSSTIRIIGSCNGVLCLTDDIEASFWANRDVYLFNPSIQKFRMLGAECSCYAEWLCNVKASYAVMGFGFCELEKDYRVVRIVYSVAPDSSSPTYRAMVEVYSLKSGKWRRAKTKVKHPVCADTVAFVDGRLHWLASRRAGGRLEWVMSFDLRDEVIREVEMPKGYDDDCVVGVCPGKIMNWNGSIGLCVSKPAGDRWQFLRCCFWVMKKDTRGKASWKKLYSILMRDDPTGIAVGLTWTGKIIIDALNEQRCANTKTAALNPADLKSKDLALDGPHTVDARFTESLVLLTG